MIFFSTHFVQEVNLANNSLNAIPDSWIDLWGNLNSTGKLSHKSPSSGAPVIILLGNSLKRPAVQEAELASDVLQY